VDPERTPRRLSDAPAHERYEILAESGLLDERTHVLKAGDTFAIFDRYGDVRRPRAVRHGLFHGGTRFLSELALYIHDHRPLLLGSGVRDDNQALRVDLTNPDLQRDGQLALPRDAVHVRRRVTLEPGACRVALELRSFAREPVELELRLDYAADYIDVFELRGLRRERRGRELPTRIADHSACLEYEGLDGVVRKTRLHFSPAPQALNERAAFYRVSLKAGEEQRIDLRVECEPSAPPQTPWLARAVASAPQGAPCFRTEIESSSRAFETWLRRSRSDLAMMLTDTPWGPYPYAGVPWFSTPFGRDAIITALATLWIEPAIARSVLRFLAAYQAERDDAAHDCEPGKIVHEMRGGEMAALREIPFARYYGSVDVTPLFLVLAAEYHERTADTELLAELWPQLERAATWIERHGDGDGDGFVEYQRRSPDGLSNHGWKDSRDSISHDSGDLADGAIALCEVQGYVYAAWRGLARLARALGRADGTAWERSAQALRERFARSFWSAPLDMYALALDGRKQPCLVQSSNAGHCLFTGIAAPEHAERLAERFLGEELFSGWGVRTLATSAARYNPMSYHNGSIWPHDNALIAWGLAQYGFMPAAVRILEGLFDASRYFEHGRLPELFCGFPRRAGEGPTLYPVACSPQAWASASPLLLLQAVLGLRIDAAACEVRFTRPSLPAFLSELTLHDLHICEHSVDVRVERIRGTTGITVLQREGPVRVVVEG
jgi:glycogen debranching enzyme